MVLALFIFTVAAALLATQDTKHFTLKGDAAANNTLLDEFSTVNEVSPGNQVAVGSVPPPAATALARLRRISGVQGIVEFRADPRCRSRARRARWCRAPSSRALRASAGVRRELPRRRSEEYARHIGHADFLREQIDGATGE